MDLESPSHVWPTNHLRGLRPGRAVLANDARRWSNAPREAGVVLIRPGWQPVPCIDAPAVVALDDQRGLVVQRGEPSRIDITRPRARSGQRQVVHGAGAVAVLGVVLVDAAPDIGYCAGWRGGQRRGSRPGQCAAAGRRAWCTGRSRSRPAMAARRRCTGRGRRREGDFISRTTLLQGTQTLVQKGSPCDIMLVEHVAVGPVANSAGSQHRSRSRRTLYQQPAAGAIPPFRRRRRTVCAPLIGSHPDADS